MSVIPGQDRKLASCDRIPYMLHKFSPRLLDSEPMQRCCLGKCEAACCLHGVWIDQLEAEDILAHAENILPHMPEDRRDPQAWFDGRTEPDDFTSSRQVLHSTVLETPTHYGGTECIFLRSDHKCALQVAGQAAGLHPWRFKPFYCVLHPLDLDEEGRITLDETDLLLDEPGSCLRPSDQSIPLVETFEPELSYLLDPQTYQLLLDQTKQNR
jgi:hypothetical protein